MTEQVEQWICIKFCVKLEHYLYGNHLDDSEGCSYGQLVIGSFITTMCRLMHHVLCRVFWWNIKSPRWLSPDLAPCDFWLFPKLKSPLKGQNFRLLVRLGLSGKYDGTADGNWENCVRSQGASFEDRGIIAQCFLYLVSSSINGSIFHITWLDTFRTDLIYCMILFMCCSN